MRARSSRFSPMLMVHGGAGPRPSSKRQAACLAEALAAGFEVLRTGAPSLDAVETAIRVLEGSGLFNAGTGSRLQLDGVKRMDASLMDGKSLRAGAVASIETVRHPISAARVVMENTAHVLIVGHPATRLARHFGLERQPRRGTRSRFDNGRRPLDGATRATLRVFRELSRAVPGKTRGVSRETVGAVALDAAGNLAAGASTGGMGFMLPGRVGDSPLIGSGVYADDEGGAVSMTGMGEGIIRIGVAKEIMERLLQGASPSRAAGTVLAKLTRRVYAEAGALVLARDGRYAIRHSSTHMVAGYWNGKGQPVVKDEF